MITPNTIYQEDCLIGMKRIKDKSIDMILCDLPYGVLKSSKNPHTKWDVVIPFEPLWQEYKRIIKDRGVIILTAVQPFATDLINSNRSWFRYELIWCKSRSSGFLNAKKMPNKCHENVLVFYKRPPKYHPQKYRLYEGFNRKRRAKRKGHSQGKAFKIKKNLHYEYIDDGTRYPDTLLEFQSVSRQNMHPTEKPVDLFAWLIRSYTKPGDMVLDNCMGSGTTALASLQEGRKYIGFETDPIYAAMAKQRIAEFKKQKKS